MDKSMLLTYLLSAQGKDGGWGYGPSESKAWTEPTAYALLALHGERMEGRPVEDGLTWLKKHRRPDGTWAPCAVVDESTWVTSLVVLLESVYSRGTADSRAVEWILQQTGKESWLRIRYKHWLMGARRNPGYEATGWPWYPGSAAWVTPTALTVMALECWSRKHQQPAAMQRAEEGREYLMARRCADGGWNHGSAKSLGIDAESYPETTGTALLALRGVSATQLEPTVALAARQLTGCPSAEGRAWLRMALVAHGGFWPRTQGEVRARGVLAASLSLLADRAEKDGKISWE